MASEPMVYKIARIDSSLLIKRIKRPRRKTPRMLGKIVHDQEPTEVARQQQLQSNE